MPNWQPNWEDVRWNYAAADRAAAELDHAAGELEPTSDARRQVADASAAEWRGTYRRRFDQQLTETLRAAWWQAGEFATLPRVSAARRSGRATSKLAANRTRIVVFFANQ